MTIQMQRYWDKDKPTYFVEKCLSGIFNKDRYPQRRDRVNNLMDCIRNYKNAFRGQYDSVIDLQNPTLEVIPKLHTIRPGNRFKEGTKLHFKQWTGRPYHSPNYNFAPVIECISGQSFEVLWYNQDSDYPEIKIDKQSFFAYEKEGWSVINELVLNDGFESVESFFNYFSSDFKGQIIHWTNLKY